MMFTLSSVAALLSLVAIPVRAANIPVTVGGVGILKYDPASVTANPGDVVVFTFKQKNHTATQSTLANPCTKAAGGFDSGFIPVADTVTAGFPVAQYTVVDTNPVYVYCAQANHCQSGMVFAINPGNTLAAFQAAAAASGGAASGTSSAAYGYPTSTTTSGSTTDHKIIVGGTGVLSYSPSNITAQQGDTVTFEFHQKNHTATQSTFADPCRSVTLTSTTGQIGLDSGFMPVAANATTFPTWTIQINDTTPLWFYCKQATHCGSGMVFAVNAVEGSSKSFEDFQALAMQLNGTGASSSSSAGYPSASSSGATKMTSGAGIAGLFIAVAFGLFL